MTTSPHGVLLDVPRLGAQQPRVCNYPSYSSTAGDEAVELAATAGLVLDPWQQLILRASLGEKPDGRWSAFEVALIVGRQNGKGSVLEARVLAGLLLFGETLQLWSAHEFKTAAEAFRRVQALFENSDDLRRRVKRVNQASGNEGIELSRAAGGGRLRFVARSKGSGRGFSGDLVILDEAYALTGDQVEALMPTLSARPNPQIWYTSSPPLDSLSGAQLFNMRRRGVAGADGLAYFDWGADADLEDLSGLDLDDRDLWAETNPAFGIRVSEEFISRERAAMSDTGFARERLGVWPRDQGSGGLIPAKLWAQLVDAGSGTGDEKTFALDVTPMRDHTSIAVYSPRPDGLGHVELIEYRPGTDWVVRRLAELKARWNPVAIALDPRSPAGSLLLDLAEAGIKPPADPDRPRRGDLALAGSQDVAAACGRMVDAARQDQIRHIDQAHLNLAVAGAAIRPLGDSWAWARKTAQQDISPLVAITLARWAHEVRAPLVTSAYSALANIW